MLHFYDGQIRRYLTQIIRLLSNFSVKYGDGTLIRVPVLYGDSDRQIAHILQDNSENKIGAAPRMAVYISNLEMDRTRLSDSSYVGKLHIREREYGYVDDNPSSVTYGQTINDYNSSQGNRYTVERLMPTPYKLTCKVDIWSTSTDQKLQILEQLLVLFNPSLEIQTTDNYIDWTSLSTLELTQMTFSNRSIPVGANNNIDVATLTLEAPIYISPPVKVKQLGVITNIIAGITQGQDSIGINDPTMEFGNELYPSGSQQFNVKGVGELLSVKKTTIEGFGILVINGQAQILSYNESVSARNDSLDIPVKHGEEINWRKLLDLYPGKYKAGFSKLYLKQNDYTEVVGTISLNALDENYITINYDEDTFPTNTNITTATRPASPGTFDAIVDPTRVGPNHGLAAPVAGTRYLIVESINTSPNVDGTVGDTPYTFAYDGPDAWKGTDGSDPVAYENDIIEYNGIKWVVVFNAAQSADQLVYQTNIYTGVQYKWNGQSWIKSFEGEYRAGTWRLEL